MKKKVIFAVWFVILSIPLSYMMGSHSLSLNPSRAEALRGLTSAEKKWQELHFLGADCGCSENVYKSLVGRVPDKDINEHIFVIGKNEIWVKALKEKGYSVTVGGMDEYAKKYSINAVPQLTILDEEKKMLYSGGYTKKRGPASAVEDQAILKELKEKKNTEERPIFGCLNGSINRKNADPLKLKY